MARGDTSVRVDLSLKTYSLTLGRSRRHTFQITVRSKFVGEASASLKSSVIALLSWPDITVGTAVTELT